MTTDSVTPSERAMETAGKVVREWFNSNPLTVLFPGEDEKLAHGIADALRAEREQCCKAICQGCAEGAELKGDWHFWTDPKARMQCQARAIRNLKEQQ